MLSLHRCRGEVGAFASSLVPEAYDPVKGSMARQHQWLSQLATALRPQVTTPRVYDVCMTNMFMYHSTQQIISFDTYCSACTFVLHVCMCGMLHIRNDILSACVYMFF